MPPDDSTPPNMLGGPSMFSNARTFTINGGTFNINAQQPPPNRPPWGLGPSWARYIAHLEARLAELEALLDLNTINLSIKDVPNPDNQAEYGDDLWSAEFSSGEMDRGGVVDVSGDRSGHLGQALGALLASSLASQSLPCLRILTVKMSRQIFTTPVRQVQSDYNPYQRPCMASPAHPKH
ncbi:hypothetical protein DFH09DRAFT_1295028 [Mycena vulgaris]|nr:hypothetical protein DFH09DRAFT_1295028 [Mycena vulgaris]